jgi:hypothetical protein
VGGAMPGVEFKILSVPDMQYNIEDINENG